MPDLQPYYQNDLVTLYKGDCLEIMPKLNITFDACITDPPYGTTACKWDSVIPFEPMWDNLKSLVKSNGAICLFGSEPFSSALRMSNIKMFKYDWIWEKERPSNVAQVKNRPLKYSENISVFYNNQSVYNPQMFLGKQNHSVGKGIRNKTNEITIKSKSSVYYKKKSNLKYPKNIIFFTRGCSQIHPTQKPVSLIEYLIKTYTNENETILDFTCGSGTTGVAAMNTNRRCVLIEQEEKYCDITIQRLQQTEKQIAERLF